MLEDLTEEENAAVPEERQSVSDVGGDRGTEGLGVGGVRCSRGTGETAKGEADGMAVAAGKNVSSPVFKEGQADKA